ncbi:MAG: hypothetical protein KJZ86_19095, partial [Caldilineaceae bacterium]|nr:hypothetical protein [Caldilineaceae bacterium]
MTWNPARVRRHLQNRTFSQLFIEELGWDNLRERLPVDVDGTRYLLEPVAHKRGVVAFVHRAGGELPDNRVRRKIETQVARSHREHVIIYTDGPGSQQVWQWVRREAGKPLSNREHRFDSQQSGESLIQKLEAIRFSLDEEDDLTLTDVVGSVRAAFNVERATKKFYTEFKREHDAFQKFLQGIPDEEMERWYVSVMLNRLMFLYFIQKKGFLAGDRDYLRSKLSASQSRGEDRYYRDFLCPLFFEGFAKAKEQRTPVIHALLGDIPYLNGGIFQQHQVEQLHGQTIAIPDRAFDRLFDFFDNYQWHLDDRPLRDDREINPDVLGYIFEQYINQKQMGAYYTKEDITDYIGKNTILPFLCDRAQKEYPDGFRGPNGAWMLLQRDPARYIYPAVAKGVELPLPAEIAAGIDDVSQRGEWNTPTPEEFALPTEIWRETMARRQRYAEVHGKLERGEVQSINDLITLNLDIRQFVQDVIEQSERPETVRAFWKALTGVSVLDPTCGSGAFLFAALNILEPLYEACLIRMQAFVEESGPEESPLRFKDFRTELEQMARHPNQKYFVYKSIVVNNLYGVDLMAEATEIAKLRLFLKLVAQVDEVSKLEPLPDIDFNIRAGNTLVGFATYGDVEETVRGDRLLLLPEDEELLAEIREEAEAVERLFGRFRRMQTGHDVSEWGEDYATTKAILTQRLQALDERLNRLLA